MKISILNEEVDIPTQELDQYFNEEITYVRYKLQNAFWNAEEGTPEHKNLKQQILDKRTDFYNVWMKRSQLPSSKDSGLKTRIF